MTDEFTVSMFGSHYDEFLREYAPKFRQVLNSKDIQEVVRWFEEKYQEVEKHPVFAARSKEENFDENLGFVIGEMLGKYIVDKYKASSYEEKKEWNSNRWLHHGAIGELLAIRGEKEDNSFLVGLGRGLMDSDKHDKDEWHTAEFWVAKRTLEQMR